MKRINKKASVLDLPLLIVGLVLIIFVTMVSDKVLEEYNTNVNGSLSASSLLPMEKGMEAIRGFDYLFTFYVVGVLITLVISALMINTHPVFAIPMLIICTILLTVLVAPLANVYGNFTDTDELRTTATHYPVMDLFMNKFTIIFLVMMSVFMIVLFTKSYWDQGGGG
jgi:hypothetical protein